MSGPKQCRSCGAAIVFAKNINTGKVAPYDAGGSLTDTTGFELRRSGSHLTASYVDRRKRPEFDGRLHQTHFATCPNVARHRR
ncbi:MAG: hypothetical protein AAF108_02810 [Planctomycetota bacterium]